DATLGQPGSAVQVGVIEAFALGYVAVYVGIAEAALAFAVDFLRTRVVKPENVSVAQDPTVQRHIGELAVRLEAARLVLEQSASAAGRGATEPWARRSGRSRVRNFSRVCATRGKSGSTASGSRTSPRIRPSATRPACSRGSTTRCTTRRCSRR